VPEDAEPDYLDLDDLVAAAEAATGRPAEVRDYGLLESAAQRPATTVFGADAYPTIHEKAAALLHSIVRNHPLVDGNKRLGWVAVRLFYVMNGHELRAEDDDAYDFVIGVAAGEISEIAEIGAWLARHAEET